MKKLIALATSIVLLCSAVFARDIYDGDIEFHFGVGFDTVDVDCRYLGERVNESFGAKEGVFGMQSWHLFKPVDVIGLGFMAGYNLGVGVTDKIEMGGLKGNKTGYSVSFNGEFGPAIGLYLGDVVRFGGSVGLTYGFNSDMPFKYDDSTEDGTVTFYTNYIGFTTNLQAKFLPNNKCNPIIGWKLINAYNDQVSISTSGSLYSSSLSSFGDFIRDYSGDYYFTQNIFYIGLGISW